MLLVTAYACIGMCRIDGHGFLVGCRTASADTVHTNRALKLMSFRGNVNNEKKKIGREKNKQQRRRQPHIFKNKREEGGGGGGGDDADDDKM